MGVFHNGIRRPVPGGTEAICHGSFSVSDPRIRAIAYSVRRARMHRMGSVVAKGDCICVLIVEDDDDSREMLSEWVLALGHRHLGATNAQEAISHASQSHPKLALIDLGLPGIDGYEVAKQLRAAAGHSIRLVALTGYSDGISRQTADAAGFDDFVVKPILPEVLAGLLQTSLG